MCCSRYDLVTVVLSSQVKKAAVRERSCVGVPEAMLCKTVLQIPRRSWHRPTYTSAFADVALASGRAREVSSVHAMWGASPPNTPQTDSLFPYRHLRQKHQHRSGAGPRCRISRESFGLSVQRCPLLLPRGPARVTRCLQLAKEARVPAKSLIPSQGEPARASRRPGTGNVHLAPESPNNCLRTQRRRRVPSRMASTSVRLARAGIASATDTIADMESSSPSPRTSLPLGGQRQLRLTCSGEFRVRARRERQCSPLKLAGSPGWIAFLPG